ncbi:MAG: hypothetical protein N3I35_00950 [Clostridia bacterium]|nr:hypothetical protein [Clostridia bacterium]
MIDTADTTRVLGVNLIEFNTYFTKNTADRNNISNEDDPKLKWVLDEARKILIEDIKPLADYGYFKLRKLEEADSVESRWLTTHIS